MYVQLTVQSLYITCTLNNVQGVNVFKLNTRYLTAGI